MVFQYIHKIVQPSNSRMVLCTLIKTPYSLVDTPRFSQNLPPNSKQLLIYFLTLWICLFRTLHINEITYMVFVSGFFHLG